MRDRQWEWLEKRSGKELRRSRIARAKTDVSTRAELRALVAALYRDGINISEVVLLMNQATASRLAKMVNPLGLPSFPAMSAEGGSILGIPAFTNNKITAATGIVAAQVIKPTTWEHA